MLAFVVLATFPIALIVGGLVRRAVDDGVELATLPLPVMQAVAPEIGADVKEWLDPARAVDRRDVVGGPAKKQIEAELARLGKELGPGPEKQT